MVKVSVKKTNALVWTAAGVTRLLIKTIRKIQLKFFRHIKSSGKEKITFCRIMVGKRGKRQRKMCVEN